MLSVVIPCYNEAASLPPLLDRCRLLAARRDIEIVLVDNGSTDDSAAVLERLLPDHPNCRSVRVDVNRGYGFGILAGLRACTGDTLGWTHADLQADVVDVLEAYAVAEREGPGAFVKGRRFGRPAGDVMFTVAMSLFESMLLRHRLWDINAQPTLFSRRFFESWDDPPHDFALDLYAYHHAREAGLRIRRFPVRFGDRVHGTSHWNVDWAAKRRFIRRTLDYSFDLEKRARR